MLYRLVIAFLAKSSESESEVAQSCPTLCDAWTVACQAPLSMGFSKQEYWSEKKSKKIKKKLNKKYWSGLPFPSPGDLPYPGIEPRSPTLQADALTSAPPGKSKHLLISWLQSPSAVILEPKKIKYFTVSIVSPSICHEVMGP